MNKLKIILLLSSSLSIVGCSSSTEKTSYGLDAEKYPKQRSFEWCQKNYSSASVSAKDRERTAKHCDTQARQAYLAAKKKDQEKEK